MNAFRLAAVASMMVATLIGTALLPEALGCSCIAPPPPAQALQMSAAVFLGKVVAIDAPAANGSQLTVTLDVERWWKGGDNAQIKVVTSSSSASCGFGFQKRGQYLVYAYAGKQGDPLSVSLCSRTADAKNARAAGDFKALGEGTAPDQKS